MLSKRLQTSVLTIVALVAFAGNSVLCRIALKDQTIDPASFTFIRIAGGAVFLVILLQLFQRRTKRSGPPQSAGSWVSSLALLGYAVAFSYAYISLDTGAGALILFGSVQITMVLTSLIKGEQLSIGEWLGLLLAFCGMSLLLVPGASAPSLYGFALMALSGIAWASYTLRGRNASEPVAETAGNFSRATAPALLIAMVTLAGGWVDISSTGVWLALASGALASGAGYAIWYSVLPHLHISQAAVLQLSVPLLAAAGGLIFSAEPVTLTFVASSVLVLGGILLVIYSRQANN